MLNFNVAELMARREGDAESGMSDADLTEHGLDSRVLLESMARVYVHVAFRQSSWKQERQLTPASIAVAKEATMATISEPAGFLKSMATDERCFKPEVFAKVAAVFPGEANLGMAFQAVADVATAVAELDRAQASDNSAPVLSSTSPYLLG